MNLNLKLIVGFIVLFVCFSCNVLKTSNRLLYYSNKNNNLSQCPENIYYGVYYDSVVHYAEIPGRTMKFSSGSTFIKFQQNVSMLMKTFADSLKTGLLLINEQKFKMDDNVRFSPEA